MATKKKIKLKAPLINFFKIVGVILVLIVAAFIYYSYQLSIYTDIGYSKKSSEFIFWNNLKSYVLSVGENKTLDAAFSSSDYKKKNLEKYQAVQYVDQDNFIKNINNLLKRGYTTREINIIFKHGNSEEVTEFAKRDKIRYLEEFYSVDYAKLKNYDRYVAYSDETGEDDEETVLIVNLDLDKENYVDPIEISEFSMTMLVNKHRKMTEDFKTPDLVEIEKPYAREGGVKANRTVVAAFKEMYKAAEAEGYGLVINSAYRSYQDQVEICETYRNLYGDDYVTNYVSQPGFSEHQTGLGLDIGSTTANVFVQSKEYQWMNDNAYKYGFILRFPKKYVNVTGYNTEPWHYRYVGKKIAKYIHENEIPFEEYYARFLDK